MAKYDVVAKVSDGNAFMVMAAVVKAMRKAGASEEEIKIYRDEAMSSDYDNLLQVSMKMVDLDLGE